MAHIKSGRVSFKLGFRNKSAQEQLTICETTLRSISALDEGRRRSVKLDAVRDAVTAARESEDRVTQLRSELSAEIARRKQRLSRARLLVTCGCSGVLASTGPKRAALLAAGLEVERPKSPVGLPDEPTIMLSESRKEGAVFLRWTRPVRRCVFHVQWRAGSAQPDQWQPVEVSARQSFTFKSLKPGEKYWFRVRALNAHGYGPWSQPATARVR